MAKGTDTMLDIEPIELFELKWSHYCQKVRFAASVKQLPLKRVEVFAFGPSKEVRSLKARKLYPIVRDPNTGTEIGDSTQIMLYLDKTYPQQPRLFPADPVLRQRVLDVCIECDSTFGLAARRIGYTRVITEYPQLLWDLFVVQHYPAYSGEVYRWIGGNIIGIALCQRFRMQWNVEEKQFDILEQYLDKYTEQIRGRKYLIGDSITAADISLISLVLPLRIVPFVADQPRWAPLFHWIADTLAAHGEPPEPIYQPVMRRVRAERQASRVRAVLAPPLEVVRRCIETVGEALHALLGLVPDAPPESTVYRNVTSKDDGTPVARNDHQPVMLMQGVGGLLYSLATGPYYVFVKMRRDLRISAKQGNASTAGAAARKSE